MTNTKTISESKRFDELRRKKFNHRGIDTYNFRSVLINDRILVISQNNYIIAFYDLINILKPIKI